MQLVTNRPIILIGGHTRAYGGGVLGFQETPFDSRPISKITCCNKYMIINILASYAYVPKCQYNIIPFRNFYANWSLTVSLTSTHSSNIMQLRFNQNIVIIDCGFIFTMETPSKKQQVMIDSFFKQRKGAYMVLLINHHQLVSQLFVMKQCDCFYLPQLLQDPCKAIITILLVSGPYVQQRRAGVHY